MSLKKIDSIIERLVAKMKMSQTPVPGYVVSLSGTDSVISFHVCYQALFHFGIENQLFGVHFIDYVDRPKKFETHTIPWLEEKYPKANIKIVQPQGGNYDPYRWAHIHRFATTQNKWTVGSINATEHYLGKYTLLHNACSVQPIRNVWKSEVMAACEELGVPDSLLESSRIPDCLCGRDEFMAQNIELIDQVIRMDVRAIETYGLEAYVDAVHYIKTLKDENSFRQRVPYVP